MNFVNILGASGSKTKDTGTTSFQIFTDILIDAGNVISILGEDTTKINHIFLTHSHSDHILDLPFIIESFFESRKETLYIYASKETINSLKKHTFNDSIWPDFSKINLLNSDKKALEFIEIYANETVCLRNYKITAFDAKHIPGAFGYEIIKDNDTGYIISGDTYENDELKRRIDNNPKIKSLIIECSFPSYMNKLAFDSQHLTPKLVSKILSEFKRKDIQIFLYHLKPLYFNEIKKEIEDYGILKNGGKILHEGDVIHVDKGQTESDLISQNKFERIMEINLELSSEIDKDKLFEMILTLTRELTHCEAGTLYILSKDKKHLDFKVIQNDPLNIYMGGTKDEIQWNSIPLYLEDGSKNTNMVATTCALEKKIINIPDVYDETKYDFQGTKNFDKSTGYRSKSMLVIPLENHEKDVIGVLQLINKTKIIDLITNFTDNDEKIIKALASQAAMALTNSWLINSLEEFLNSFITTIGHAIDAKSHHTMNHIANVEKISLLLAQAINDDDTIYKDVKYTQNDFQQIKIAAWMHDIGKISMPESIIDKSTKLYAITDRIKQVKEKFEILKRDSQIAQLKGEISQEEYEKQIAQYDEDYKFLEEANIGGEFMDDSKIERIEKISQYTYLKDGVTQTILNEDEKYNLSIRKGTLTKEEKDIMNNHAKLSLEMLMQLPFPKKYKDVLNIAANHHEKLNGKGYPRGLKEEDLSLEDRIMILADIFEALTSSDRPYKSGKKLSEVFKILSFMVKDNEIDGRLLRFFHEHDILKKYVNENLKPAQIDKSQLLY
ncbi:HD domain-containing phosphohydrolase [Arcobacter sp. YIC-80]|uniref:HD domain-containing phosphohydrolase n=1 Tax=unclassified Arcobacter TaxID=2593671 RepID=UPI00384A49D6